MNIYQAAKVRELYRTGMGRLEIAKIFNSNIQTISNITNNWSHIAIGSRKNQFNKYKKEEVRYEQDCS